MKKYTVDFKRQSQNNGTFVTWYNLQMSKQFYFYDSEAQIQDLRSIKRKAKKTLPIISNKPVPLHVVSGKKAYTREINLSEEPQLWAHVTPPLKYKQRSTKYGTLNSDQRSASILSSRISSNQKSNPSLLLLDQYFRRKNRSKLKEIRKLPNSTLKNSLGATQEEDVDRQVIRDQINNDILALLKRNGRTSSLKKAQSYNLKEPSYKSEEDQSLKLKELANKYKQKHKLLEDVPSVHLVDKKFYIIDREESI